MLIHSTSLASLGFFKKLRVIEGKTHGINPFSLRVHGNPHLEALFPQNVTIERGRILFHSNPKMPMKIIEEFKQHVVDLRGVDKLPANEVSSDSFRPKNPCQDRNVKPLIVHVTRIGSIATILELKPIVYDDERQLLSYLLYYMPAPDKNVSMFDSHGECGGGAWALDEIEDNYQNGTTITHILTQLKPDTQYAYFVRTYTVDDELLNGLSEIHYFKTQPEQHQITAAFADVDSSEDDILPSNPYIKTKEMEDDEETKDLKCMCVSSYERRSKFSKTEASELIEFQNALHNYIYVK